MLKNISRLAGVLSLVLASQVQASDSGFALAIDGGLGHQKLDVSGGYSTESGNSFSPALNLSYQINSNFSVVAQYADYGEADLFDFSLPVNGTPVKLNVSAETKGYSLVGQYMSDRVVESWSWGGKLGLMSWDSNVNVTAKAAGNSAYESLGDDSGTDIYGGVVAAYAINEQLDFTITGDWFLAEVGATIIPGEKTELLNSRFALGLKYHF